MKGVSSGRVNGGMMAGAVTCSELNGGKKNDERVVKQKTAAAAAAAAAACYHCVCVSDVDDFVSVPV
jgi:hypothetical protein